METFLVWLPAGLLYAVFLGWYLNWRGKLSPAEVAAYLARLEASGLAAADSGALDVVRRFLAADDGRAFHMLNLLRIAPGDIPDPVTGQPRPGRVVLEDYTSLFLRALLARGGHPEVVARKVGGYIEAWGVEPDPGWTVVGIMRYRSRRDLAELVLDPRFSGAHAFKVAALPNTFAFPTQPRLQASLSPVVAVGLILALLAALGQISWLLSAGGA
jgi:hypothetical protein